MAPRNQFYHLMIIILILIGIKVHAADEKGAVEYRLQFSPSATRLSSEDLTKQPPTDQRLAVVGKRLVQGPPPRQRNPELSPEHIVIIFFEPQRREITRIIIPDPRLVRLENFGPSGEIESSETLYLATVEFPIVIPADPRISDLKIYHPQWTGAKFILELIGEAKLP